MCIRDRAITDAARRGVSVFQQTLFTSTFPCHECTKHIVAAGISEVVYVEPYPKSLALQLFDDSIHLEKGPGTSPVVFRPFVGVGPRMYTSLFAMVERKDQGGKTISWDPRDAGPRIIRYETPDYLVREDQAMESDLKPILEVAALKRKKK